MEPIHGIILAGGKSSRMGEPKELMELHGQPILLNLVHTLKKICSSVTVVANRPFRYPFLPEEINQVEDMYKESGPIGGIHAGMAHAPCSYHMVLACDYPLIQLDSLKDMIREIQRNNQLDAVIPFVEGKHHPLCAIYRHRTLPLWERALKERKLKVFEVIQKLAYQSYTASNPAEFMNMNTRLEYLAIQQSCQMEE